MSSRMSPRANQSDLFPRAPRTPQAFGRWGNLATTGELTAECMMDDPDGPQYYGARVQAWLADRGIRTLPPEVARVLGWCESGAEVMTALAFAAPGRALAVHPTRARALVAGEDSLELQVPITGSPYRTDFRWTSRHGVALVEVYGYSAHRDRLATDRARHRQLVALGYTVHYLPAELVVRNADGAWPAVRRRQLEVFRRRRQGRGAWCAPSDAITADPVFGGVAR